MLDPTQGGSFSKWIPTFAMARDGVAKVQSIAAALLAPTVETFRIDKRVRDFYAERSMQNARRVGSSILWLAVTYAMTKQIGGVQTVASIVPVQFVTKRLNEWIEKEAPFPPPPFFPAQGAISGIALGVAVSVVLVPLNRRIMLAAWAAIEAMGIQSSSRQHVAVLLETPGHLGMVVTLWGAVVQPIVEETLFRGHLFKDGLFTTEKSERTPSYLKTTKTVIGTSLIFGLLHISPFQGWANLPVFIATTCVGGVFGTLRAVTGNLWASTTLHIINNSYGAARRRGIDLPSLLGRVTTNLTSMLK